MGIDRFYVTGRLRWHHAGIVIGYTRHYGRTIFECDMVIDSRTDVRHPTLPVAVRVDVGGARIIRATLGNLSC